MAATRVYLALVLVAVAGASPHKPAFWKGTALDSTVEEMRALCANEDAIACLKYKFMSFLDTVFKKDTFQLSENVDVTRNSFRANEITSRGETGFEDTIQEYIQGHDFTFKLPVGGSSVKVDARNLDQDELDLKLSFSDSKDVQARGKSKIKKIMIPILVFVLLKAMTLIPLALGVLGLKAWNALQLSFFSFVISIALAVFQLCKKIASDNAHPQISAHGPWESAYSNHYARSFDSQPVVNEDAQQMAYSAYA